MSFNNLRDTPEKLDNIPYGEYLISPVAEELANGKFASKAIVCKHASEPPRFKKVFPRQEEFEMREEAKKAALRAAKKIIDTNSLQM